MDNTTTDFHTWRRLHEERFTQMADTVDRLKDTVHGNGKPGMDEILRTVHADQIAIRRSIEKFRSMAVWALALFVASMGWRVLVWAIQGGLPVN